MIRAAAEAADPRELQLIPLSFRYGVVGFSHQTADLNLRSQLSSACADADALRRRLTALGIEEFCLLSTCNRLEVYTWDCRADEVMSSLSGLSGIEESSLRRAAYALHGEPAVRHLFRVASGLESAVLGESEIMAQVKCAWSTGRESGSVGPRLESLFRHAVMAGKRARTESAICRGVTSVASLAVREAARFAGGLEGRTILIVGAGKTAQRAAKDLARHNLGRLHIANRTEENGQKLATEFGASAHGLDELAGLLAVADVVFATVTSSECLISEELMAGALRCRNGRPIVAVDLGVPRNISQEALSLPGVDSIDLEALQSLCDENSKRREDAIPDASAVVDEEIERFAEAFMESQAAPTIESLLRMGEIVRSDCLDWVERRMGALSDRERTIVEDLSRRIVKSMLQSPIEGLKSHSRHDRYPEIAAHLFGLSSKELDYAE